MFFFRQRIHESVAIAAVLSTSITLHALWIANLLMIRLPAVSGFFESGTSRGAVGGLCAFGVLCFLVVWCVLSLVFRGRDCSHHRESAFWFLVTSVIIFFVMTMPPVFVLVL